MDGLELCRLIRATPALARLYLILVTARTSKSRHCRRVGRRGRDDYLTSRSTARSCGHDSQVGRRILGLQRQLADQVRELQEDVGPGEAATGTVADL